MALILGVLFHHHFILSTAKFSVQSHQLTGLECAVHYLELMALKGTIDL